MRRFIIAPMPSRLNQLGRWLLFATAAIPTAALSISFCAWIFACGCKAWWAGAAAACNIHMLGAKHCPWCIYNGQGFRVAFLAILAAQAAISFLPGKLAAGPRLLIALATFPAIGATVAVIYGWVSHYWS